MIKAFLAKYAILIAIGVVVAMSTAIGVQTLRLSWAQTEVVQLKADNTILEGNVATLDGSNKKEKAARVSLQSGLDECVGQKRLVEQATEDAMKELQKANLARARLEADASKRREQTYATDPTCNTWARASVCPAITAGLRDEWDEANRRIAGDRGEAATSVRRDSFDAYRTTDAASTAFTFGTRGAGLRHALL